MYPGAPLWDLPWEILLPHALPAATAGLPLPVDAMSLGGTLGGADAALGGSGLLPLDPLPLDLLSTDLLPGAPAAPVAWSVFGAWPC